MKKIFFALLSLLFIAPCFANIHINPNAVAAVVQEHVAPELITSVVSEYNNRIKASNGAGVSGQDLWDLCTIAGWDIKSPGDKQHCQEFVHELVDRANIKFYPACAKENKGKSGYVCVEDFFTNKLYGGTQVNLTPALSLAQEYIRLKHNDTNVLCDKTPREITVVMGAMDYGIQCTSYDKNIYYEFVFDDVYESTDKKIQDSIQSSVCKMYNSAPITAGCSGTGTTVGGNVNCWSASCKSDATTCAKINQSMGRFGYSATYKNNTCEISFESVRNSGDLKTAYGIDNFVFCHGIQVDNAPNVEAYLKQYVSEIAGTSSTSVVCDSGFRTYTGDGCKANGITDFKDDIKTCRVGDNQIDFVFDDINEKWRKTVAGGVQGMSCIVSGGTYSGKRCIGLGEQQCEVLRKSNLTECPECKAAKWDSETQTCVLPSSASAQNLQRGINITMIVGGAIVGIVITVATVGSATAAVAGTAAATKSAIAFTAIETVGAGIEVAAQLKIDAIADDFLVESNKCKDATCAKKMLAENLQRMANVQNNMTDAEVDAVDSELARLANLIPDDDEIWATMLVNGTDMADNKAGFWESWEPEQVWRAVGIGLQLASLITGITKWAISKSSRIAKSTTAIKNKLAAAVDSVERAQKDALTGNRLVLKHEISQMRATNNLDDVEAAWRELHRKYAPRDQSLDNFKAMADNDLSKMQQMSKNWISWDNPLTQARTRLQSAEKQLNEFWRTAPDEVMDLYLDKPTEFARQYPEIYRLQEESRQMNDILNDGFYGNYSVANSDVRQIKRTAQEQIEVSKQMREPIKDALNKELSTGTRTLKDVQQEYDEVSRNIVELTTDKVLLDVGNTVQIERLDEIALLRADQIHDIIESDEWLKSMKQNWYSLTTDQKTIFAQGISDKLLEMNGIPRHRAPFIEAHKFTDNTAGTYNPKTNKTRIDFDKAQNYEEFINTLAHENGGHAIDELNPNANALGAQLYDATKDLYGASDDAYRATPTEQTAFRIGDVASVVNSYEDYNDVGEALMVAVQKQGAVPYDRVTGKISSHANVNSLAADLLDQNKSVSILLDTEKEGYKDVAKILMQTGVFDIRVFKTNPNYFEIFRK